jgi:hypothetical protein
MRPGNRDERPLSRWYFVVLAAVMLVSCYVASTPLWSGDFMLFVFPIWMTLGVYWLARMVGVSRRAGWTAVGRRWIRWAVPPLIFLGMVAVLVSDGPRRVRLALSEPSMRAYAASITERDTGECRWLGLYRSCWAEPVDGGVLIGIRDLDVLVDLGLVVSAGKGFAWLPAGRPPADRTIDDRYRRYAGDWWIWHGWDSL